MKSILRILTLILLLWNIGVIAQDSTKIWILDSSTVAIDIEEFRHIVAVNKYSNNKDSIINLKNMQILTLNSIVSNSNEIDSLRLSQIRDLKLYIEENKNPFYNTFIFGVIISSILIISGALIF
jgi:hypothetical protein